MGQVIEIFRERGRTRPRKQADFKAAKYDIGIPEAIPRPIPHSKILRLETGVAGDTGQHRRPEFHRVMECKNEIRKTASGEYAMRSAALPFDVPADTQQCGFNAPGFG